MENNPRISRECLHKYYHPRSSFCHPLGAVGTHSRPSDHDYRGRRCSQALQLGIITTPETEVRSAHVCSNNIERSGLALELILALERAILSITLNFFNTEAPFVTLAMLH